MRSGGTGGNDVRNHLNVFHQLLPDGSLVTTEGSLRAGLHPPTHKPMSVVSAGYGTTIYG